LFNRVNGHISSQIVLVLAAGLRRWSFVGGFHLLTHALYMWQRIWANFLDVTPQPVPPLLLSSGAMYNGIGLTTPRGSGTNGYVQRNLSSLRAKRPRDERGGERDEKDRERLESQLNRQPNAEILEHQRKRQLEVKCAELQDMMEEQG